MENTKDQKFAQGTQKKTEMPERKREDMSGGPKSTVRPEIDLPLQGGRAESDLSSKTPSKQDAVKTDRPGFDKSAR